MRIRTPLLFLCMLLAAPFGFGQTMPEALLTGLDYRSIGPFRGGRSAAVTGIPGNPTTFYFGATGGGVWKTTDGGQTWSNISDGYFGGSIGAVAVSQWDPNVIYVGGGEVTVRGNVSSGDGVWKSVDGGKSWKHIGLKETRHIPRIAIHPKNPDLVYVAALGHLYGPNDERGLYRSKDGGETWNRVLFVNDEVGAVDLHMDPTNARILYATMWRVKRTPYSLESGGPGSSIWKSVDGGDTWKEITDNAGLPSGEKGIMGVTVSPVNPDRVWAIIEADEGGVFRSENGGDTWRRVNSDRNLRQRAWYYTRIYADTRDEDLVYVLNVSFWRSNDGGATFESIQTPHGDHHDLWIDPYESSRMIIADDGGAQVTFDAGENWSTYGNQPTAQFYRVTTDNHFPYRILGAQQDNSTVRIPHRTDGRSISVSDWTSTAGGESGHIAPHPDNPDIVYGGSYGGYLTRVDHKTGESRSVNVWPDNPMGYGAGDLKYRFQWNYPILFSPHDSGTLYTAANVLFKTTNEGQSWTVISPDLTRNDPTTLGPSGGPITKDNTSVEYYATIFAVVETPLEKGVIWTGSDDGLIHVTRDGGQTWNNVTPDARLMPEWMQINSIEAHPTEKGGLYVAGTRYKSDDFKPYLYRTLDYGKNWVQINKGIPADHFTRVIRADPNRPGLLYVGTEYGLYVSFDDGANWQSFQQNLPLTPITDLTIKNDDLIVATQGRSFWVLDDLTAVHQLSADLTNKPVHLFTPRDTYRLRGGRGRPSKTVGENADNGVVLRYLVKEISDSTNVKIRILDNEGMTIRTYTGKDDGLEPKPGINRFVWDFSYPDAERFDGLILWGGGTQGPNAIPGSYKARIIVGADSMTVPFNVLKDPRSSATEADLKAQFDFLISLRDKVSETHTVIREIRSLRSSINDVLVAVTDSDLSEEITESGKNILSSLKTIEEALYQTKNRSNQDPLNYPIRLNNRLGALAGVVSDGDFRPTDQAVAVKNELTVLIDEQLARYRQIVDHEIPAFNDRIIDARIPAVRTKKNP